MELAQDELHVEEREGAQGEHENVRDEEGPASILVTQVREPPDVGEVHSEPDDAQEKVKIAAPGLSFSILSLVDIIFHYITQLTQITNNLLHFRHFSCLLLPDLVSHCLY